MADLLLLREIDAAGPNCDISQASNCQVPCARTSLEIAPTVSFGGGNETARCPKEQG
jgi:hypothetical protein